MSQCGGKTSKGIRCKIKCKNKFCKYHCKQSGGYKSVKVSRLHPYKCDRKSCPTGCVSSCTGRPKGGRKKQKGGSEDHNSSRSNLTQKREPLFGPSRGGAFRMGKQRRTTPRLHYAPIVVGIPENTAMRGWGSIGIPEKIGGRGRGRHHGPASSSLEYAPFGGSKRKYKLLCPNTEHSIYTKKSGFKCCSKFKIETNGGALFKKKEKSTYKPKIDLDKYPQVIIEQKRQKHLKQLVGEDKANQFCAMSDVRPGQAGYSVKENRNGLVAIIDDEIVGFLLFTPKSRGKMSGGNYMYLELICTSKRSKKRKDKKGKNIPIGTLLLTKFEEISRQLGYYKLKGESVKGAVKFYKRNGWTVGTDTKHKMTKKIY